MVRTSVISVMLCQCREKVPVDGDSVPLSLPTSVAAFKVSSGCQFISWCSCSTLTAGTVAFRCDGGTVGTVPTAPAVAAGGGAAVAGKEEMGRGRPTPAAATAAIVVSFIFSFAFMQCSNSGTTGTLFLLVCVFASRVCVSSLPLPSRHWSQNGSTLGSSFLSFLEALSLLFSLRPQPRPPTLASRKEPLFPSVLCERCAWSRLEVGSSMDGEVCGGAAFLLVSPLLPVPPLLCQSVIFPPLSLSSVCGHPFVGSVYMAFFRRMREEGTDRSFRQKKGEKMPSELLLSLFRSPFSLSAKNKHSDGGGVGKVRRDAAVFH